MVYDTRMVARYTLEDPKPTFKDGEQVIVDMSVMGGAGFLRGVIVGKGMENVIDFWLVRFDKDFGPTYPFKVTQVLHTAFVKSMPVDQLVETLKK